MWLVVVGVLALGRLHDRPGPQMIPGELLPAFVGEMALNAGADGGPRWRSSQYRRPILVQVGSHYHFAEANSGLSFDRYAARGHAPRHPRRHGRTVSSRARPARCGCALPGRAITRLASHAALGGVQSAGGWGICDVRRAPRRAFPREGEALNAGAEVTTLEVANTGDRPVQVSHYHLPSPVRRAASCFDRDAARGQRLDMPAGTVVRSTGQTREVRSCTGGAGACSTSISRSWGICDVKLDPSAAIKRAAAQRPKRRCCSNPAPP